MSCLVLSCCCCLFSRFCSGRSAAKGSSLLVSAGDEGGILGVFVLSMVLTGPSIHSAVFLAGCHVVVSPLLCDRFAAWYVVLALSPRGRLFFTSPQPTPVDQAAQPGDGADRPPQPQPQPADQPSRPRVGADQPSQPQAPGSANSRNSLCYFPFSLIYFVNFSAR